MGVTFVKGKLTSLTDPSKQVEGEFLVDTGATYTVVPKAVVDRLAIKPERRIELVLADGKVMKRGVGTAVFEMEGQAVYTPVILGGNDDSYLLGAVTLEEMGLAINPLTRKMYPMKTFV